MFPNLRLTVIAILAAITGIGCGLGLFATFRVNHEPLARLAEGSPPLQLAFDHLGLKSQPQMPLEVRLPINSAAKMISVPVIETPRADDVGPGTTVSTDPGSVQPAAGGIPEIDPSSAATVPPVVPAAQSIAMHEDEATAPNQPDAVTIAGDQQLSAPPSAPAASSSASGAQKLPAVNAAAADEQLIVPPSAPAASPPVVPSAGQTAAINAAPATDHEPAAKPAISIQKKAAKPAVEAARATPPRRVIRIVHARRTVATVASQAASQYSQTTYAQPTSQSIYAQSAYTQSTYAQPTYSWADGAGQAAVKRVQIKRPRAAKKAAPAAQSNPLPATAGLSGGQ